MFKYWGGGIISHMGVSPKWVKSKRRREMMVITMAKLRMVHASMHGARKRPGPILTVLPPGVNIKQVFSINKENEYRKRIPGKNYFYQLPRVQYNVQ